jgi:hypothetical protein
MSNVKVIEKLINPTDINQVNEILATTDSAGVNISAIPLYRGNVYLNTAVLKKISQISSSNKIILMDIISSVYMPEDNFSLTLPQIHGVLAQKCPRTLFTTIYLEIEKLREVKHLLNADDFNFSPIASHFDERVIQSNIYESPETQKKEILKSSFITVPTNATEDALNLIASGKNVITKWISNGTDGLREPSQELENLINEYDKLYSAAEFKHELGDLYIQTYSPNNVKKYLKSK